MKRFAGLLCFLFFLSLLHSLDSQVAELLKIAPENPRLLHEHSYISGMGGSKEIKKKKVSDEETMNVKVQDNITHEKNDLGLKKPDFTQIFLITFVVIILIIYRLRLQKTKPTN